MGARGIGSKTGIRPGMWDNPVFPPQKSWPRYVSDEDIPDRFLRRVKHRRWHYRCQNVLENLIFYGVVDDDDLDELAELNPKHPTLAWLKKEGAW
jgi:hypothetical protein